MSERSGTSRPSRPTALRLLVALAALLSTSEACLKRRSDPTAAVSNRCSACHGDSSRQGDALSRAAPPHDLLGATDPSYPGVGAHQIHLNASATHARIACTECHIVPQNTDDPGHADSAGPAQIVFGALAKTGGLEPSYDPIARTCKQSYCHRDAAAVWTEPRTSDAACGSCHGLPPPAPHPQSPRCSACHSAVINDDGTIKDPTLHVDGQVEFNFGPCSSCHGTNETPAPPPDTHGDTEVSAIGVGAHAAHLAGGNASRPLACTECHALPDSDHPERHVDGNPATVVLSGVATADDRVPAWNRANQHCSNTWCHSPEPGRAHDSPVWTDPSPLDCQSCHGAPPAPPHPQLSQCSLCHGAVVAADGRTIIDRSKHVDGNIDVQLPTTCTACHGGQNPAPPLDTRGDSATTFAGVGAHQTHVLGTSSSRAVPCKECHLVPKNVLDPGHIDSALPAELSFSGAAVAFGAAPTYDGKCQNTACHGDAFSDPSGGALTVPTWTRVDGTQATCGSCHALPPPIPHPPVQNCSQCHFDINADNRTFSHPELHVDGVITFSLP